MPGAPVFKVTPGGMIARAPRIGSIVAIAMATIVVAVDGVAYVASAIIYPRCDVGFQVEVKYLPPSVAGSEAMERAAL